MKSKIVADKDIDLTFCKLFDNLLSSYLKRKS